MNLITSLNVINYSSRIRLECKDVIWSELVLRRRKNTQQPKLYDKNFFNEDRGHSI